MAGSILIALWLGKGCSYKMAKHHPVESRTSPRRLKASERQHQALELRMAGVTFAVIASRLGWKTAYGAQCAVEAALKKGFKDAVQNERILDLERLDRLMLVVWPGAQQKDLDHWDRAMRVLERRAKMLGLDAQVVPSSAAQQAQLQSQSQDQHVNILIQVPGATKPVTLGEYRKSILEDSQHG